MNHIVTYFYLEKNNNMSSYGVKTKNYKKKNEYYFRCIVNFFASSILKNPKSKHYFICNEIDDIEFIPNFSFKGFLEENKVEIVKVDSKYVKPISKWAGSVYLFDAIEYFKNKTKAQDNYIFFDNDIIFNKSIENCDILNDDFDVVLYDITHEYKKNNEWICDFNGISKKYIENLIPLGGEFIALKGEFLSEFIEYFIYIQFREGLYTEEHFISYINKFYLSDKKVILLDESNNLIARVWTTLKYSNLNESHMNVKILHFPAEKEYGLKWISNYIIINNKIDKNIIFKYLGMPKRNIFIMIKIIFEKIKNKYINNIIFK